MYVVGFAESVVNVFPTLDQRLVGGTLTLAVGLTAIWLGSVFVLPSEALDFADV